MRQRAWLVFGLTASCAWGAESPPHDGSPQVILHCDFDTDAWLQQWGLAKAPERAQLVDGDPASNNGGWQWTAGTGTDAAPYFRIFNPISQSVKFDPQGSYIRRWLPELGKVPNEYVHEPWKMPTDLQGRIGCRIGVDYPEPIIDHNWARQRVLNVYGNAKK